MVDSIDVVAASIAAIQAETGKALKAQVKAQGSINDFIARSGVPRTSLYRAFTGKTVSSDILLQILHALGRYDVLNALTQPPRENPLTFLNKLDRTINVIERVKSALDQNAVASLQNGIAKPRYRKETDK